MLEGGYRLVTVVAQNFIDGANVLYHLRQNANVVVGRREFFQRVLEDVDNCLRVKRIEVMILHGRRVACVVGKQSRGF